MMLIEEFDKDRHNLADVEGLLAVSIGHSALERPWQLVDEFYRSDNRAIFVAQHSGKIIGAIGVDYTDKPHGFITHIAVFPDMRKQGVANHLIDHAVAVLELVDIEAETDKDAVGFYRSCGFGTTEIESRYPGVRRFRCVKRQS